MPARAASEHPALAGFHAPVRSWFTSSYEAPTRAQELGWPAIQSGGHALILAPTGSGKTLAAFLAAIDRLMFDPEPAKMERCRVLYISPLKALAVDVERNLRAPIVGIARYAERMGVETHAPEIHIRTGDTPSRDRAAFLRHPSDILITTPESLYLLLTSQAREALRSVKTVIIDEIHAMVGTKRGAHLALSLERLAEITTEPFQRIGLSATVRPPEEVARFLGGFDPSPGPFPAREGVPVEGNDTVNLTLPSRESIGSGTPFPKEGQPLRSSLGKGAGGLSESVEDAVEDILQDDPHPITHTPTHANIPRPVQLIDAGRAKLLDLLVEVPVEDMAKLAEVQEIPSGPACQGAQRTSIWPAIHPLILDLIRSHTSTLIFVNSRRLAERLAAALNELAGEEIVHAHHGSIAREQRQLIEDQLKSGKLPAMVATSSLELGIDMGAIDLVIQVEAPPSIASAIQRIGRAGHQIGAASKGIILPKYRGDLLACAALTERMQQGAVEEMRYLRNPLDILAQQIVAMVSAGEWRVEELERVIRRAAPFAELPAAMLDQVLDMLSGRYPSDEFAELRPRITWDRLNGVLHSREGSRRIAITNGGTIPDRGLYGVFLVGAEKGQGRVGELDEEMVFESKVGDVFLLGASSWRIEEITHDRVLVSPAPGVPGKMPFWHGESAGRPLEFGRAIGALTRALRALPPDEAADLLLTKHCLEERAARNLLQYIEDQVEAIGAIPDDRTIVVESYLDEMGDWRVCILSPFGGKVHAPWAMAIGAMVRERTDADIDILWTDDGIVVRFPETTEPPPIDWVLPDPDDVEELVIRQLGVGGGGAHAAHQGAPVNALFASRFREAAARALLLPRKHPGQRAPLWQQRKRAADLLKATSRFGSFPIVLETFRECLKDVFDMPALTGLLREIVSRDVRVVPVTSRVPSPFAAALMFNYVANFIYEGDAPLAERRAQALLVDPAQLRELLGEAELRELLDPDALETLELYLQHLTPERAVRHADGLHDLLIRLGDLSRDEVIARVSSREEAPEWIARLEKERRVVTLNIAGEPRYIAVEDAGRYRDALGIPPPPGLPTAFLEYMEDPLGDLVSRYARTHGPFTVQQVAGRYSLGIAPVMAALQKLSNTGRVVEGEFRPGGAGREWCDSGVLRALRQKSLARLRHEVEPVEQAVLGRLYLAWQNVGRSGVQVFRSSGTARTPDVLLDVIEQLQDASIPASELETTVLPRRLPAYDSRELDYLLASGEVLWTGCEPLGQHDGRISLYLTEHAPLFLNGNTPKTPPDGPIHSAVREHLAARGASFFPAIYAAVGTGMTSEVLQALWDLVWSGEATNDTLQPLRAYMNPRRLGILPGKTTASGAPRRRGMVVRGFTPASRSLSPSPARAAPPEAAGRWSLVSSLVASYEAPTPTERMAARANQLLNRFGVLTREAVQAVGIEGGFTAIYGVLKAMEEAGRVRRGYFVAGLGATQFALPGAVERLRSLREPPSEMQAVLIAATDPANPYGTAIPWPDRGEDAEGRRPMRMAGASVILVDGALAGWIGRSERQLVTFVDYAVEQLPERLPEEIRLAIAETLGTARTSKGRSYFIQEVDGQRASDTPMAAAFLEAGFTHTSQGYMKRTA